MQEEAVEFFIRNLPAANDLESQTEPVEALVRAMDALQGNQLIALEDELDFFAFTGLLGPVMKEVLASVSTAADVAKPNDSGDRRRGPSNLNGDPFLLAG